VSALHGARKGKGGCLSYEDDDSGFFQLPQRGVRLCILTFIFFDDHLGIRACIVFVLTMLLLLRSALCPNEGPNNLPIPHVQQILSRFYSTQISNFPSALPRLITLYISSPYGHSIARSLRPRPNSSYRGGDRKETQQRNR